MTTHTDVSDQLFDHALAIRFDDLPDSTVSATRRQILDTLGATIAGLDADGCAAVRAMVTDWGGRPTAQLIGSHDRVPAPAAALVNATAGRALELDDVHEQALTHTTVSLLPIALAVGAAVGGISGKDLITAVAVGNDLGVRLALAARQEFGSRTAPRRMSLTYQASTLAGAIVAAKVGGADKELMADTFGSAYSQVAGNLQGLKEGTLGVRVQQGLASWAAVTAWELARRGITGGRHNLEGAAGWFNTFHDGRFDQAALVGGLGKIYRGDEISVKPYSCCKYGHNAISAVVAATEAPAYDVRRVERIEATIWTQDMWDILVDPLSVKADPDSFQGQSGVAMAQFSLPYMLATAAARRRFTTADLTPEARRDPVVMGLLSKVVITNLNQSLSPADLPEPSSVTLVLDDGSELTGHSARPLGHVENPMTDQQIVEKFEWCAERLPAGRRREISDRVLALDSLDDALEIVRLTAPGDA